MQEAAPVVKMKEAEKIVLQQGIDQFSSRCKTAGFKYSIHENKGPWDKSLIAKESRFSDLIVISEELFFTEVFLDDQPNFFMQELLRTAECPVMVVPENFHCTTSLALAYDSSKNSMFAIKQFTNLFPQLTDLPAKFIHIAEDDNDDIPDRKLLDEYASLHYDSHGTSKLHFEPKAYINTWLENQKGVMLVTGSFSRSGFSVLLNKSFVHRVIREHSCPVFIAHIS
jgi:nucleotide-binding universal stress UspA family protein